MEIFRARDAKTRKTNENLILIKKSLHRGRQSLRLLFIVDKLYLRYQ
jgi:hypothetical protein